MQHKVIQGDCLEAMRAMEPDSVDAIVCDPPYGLEFMGKEWDSIGRSRGNAAMSPSGQHIEGRGGDKWQPGSTYGTPKKNPRCKRCGRLKADKPKYKCVCPSPDFDTRQAEYANVMQFWHEGWAREALRVIKPGGHLVAFGGSRTFHRLACAIEDAGWEIRDTLMWVYGSGFPKSHNVAVALDKEAGAVGHRGKKFNHAGGDVVSNGGSKFRSDHPEYEPYAPATDLARQYAGFGTALKPAWEPIILARKPLRGTVAATVAAYGTGCINVDKCRIVSDIDSHDLQDQGRRRGGVEDADGEGPRHAGVRGVRQNVPELAVSRGTAEVPADLRPAVREQAAKRERQPQVEQWDLERHEVGVQARAAGHTQPRGPAALRESEEAAGVRAPAGDGAVTRTAAHGDRDGAPHQRGQAGQPARESLLVRVGSPQSASPEADAEARGTGSGKRPPEAAPLGRWPANVALDTEAAALLDEQAGIPVSRFFYCAKASRREREAGLEGMPRKDAGALNMRTDAHAHATGNATAPAANVHPTVKPLALMRWLCRLVTPPNGKILDPFCGSGTTGCAAVLEGFRFLGIERGAEYVAIAERRIAHWTPVQPDLEPAA